MNKVQRYIKEYHKVKWIYISLIAMICIGPLLNRFITSTTIIRTIELLFFFTACANLYTLKKMHSLVSYSGFAKFLVIGLIIILMGIIARGEFPSSPPKFILHIISTSMPCLLPIFLLFLPNYRHQNRILRIFFYASLIYFPLVLLNVDTGLVLYDSENPWAGESIGASMPFFAAFLLCLMRWRLSRGKQLAIIVIWLIYFFLMLLNARRNVSFTLVLYATIAYFYNSFKNSRPSTKITAVVLSLFIGFVIILNFQTLAKGTFKNMYQRSTEDTRSGVELLMLADFASSPQTDWIFGRGLDGGYFQETIDKETGVVETNRKVIETGYLNLMLKGGLIFNAVIILLMLLAIIAAFRRNRKDSFYFGIILITYFIDNYTAGPIYVFNSRSILFWFMISCLLADKIPPRRILARKRKHISTENKDNTISYVQD